MDTEKTFLSWTDIDRLIDIVVEEVDLLPGGPFCAVWGVPRGGWVPAVKLAARLDLPLAHDPEGCGRTLIVDDIIDSGKTASRYDPDRFVALLRKDWSPLSHRAAAYAKGWAVFPWEGDESTPTDAVTRLLTYLGEDPTRDGLTDTPQRVVKALEEMTQGYHEDPAEILSRTFSESYDEMVLVRGVEFTSLCEHHLLPFTGTATVAYIPNGTGVVGLSKLARLVECFARRLQVQEKMTAQIAHAIHEHLDPVGVGVVVSAVHSCMACRGVRKRADMITSCLLGAFRDDPRARSEFLTLARPPSD